MYSGSNPSALRSREWLRQALIELLKEKSYQQITIKDMCKKADLSRQTFYQIYTSKEEVMEYHFMHLFEAFAEENRDFHHTSIRQLSCAFFTFFYEQRGFVAELINNNITYILEEQFETYLPKIELFCKINSTEMYPDYSVAYIAGALTQMLIHWFKQKFSISIDEIANTTETLIIGSQFII